MPQAINTIAPPTFKERPQPGGPPGAVRKKPGTIIVVLGILVLLILGLSRLLLNSKAPVKNTISVVGAATDLAPGEKVYFNSLHYVEIPRRYYSDGMFSSNEQIVGRILKRYLPQGEPITSDDLFKAKNCLSNNLETHERAISLRLDPDALVDNELSPDDMVDVISTTIRDGKHFSKTICQNARVVLAISSQALASRTLRTGDGNRVTLAVGPQEAELISHAVETSKIRLILRSRLSRKTSSLPGVEDEDLLPHKALLKALAPLIPAPLPSFTLPIDRLPEPPPQVAPQVPAPVKWVVEMFSGSRKELHEVQN